MKVFATLFSVFLALCGSGLAQVANGVWVYPSATGNLLYQLDERGQRIADFSQCGYRGGAEPLPNVTAPTSAVNEEGLSQTGLRTT